MSHSRVPHTFGLTEPFSRREPIDYEDAREALRKLAEQRREALQDLETESFALVDAERDYRKGRAEARVSCKGTTAADRKDEIDSATADLRHTRDGARMRVDIVKEKLEEVDGQRASVHRLVDWSAQLDPLVAEARGQRFGAAA